MRKVGIYSTSGDKHTRLRNQMRRLFGCTVSLLYEDARGEATLNAPIARLTEFWWSERQPDARSLWESKIELGEDFFNEIIRCPIPIDLNTLRAMKRSPLGLDLSLWLTYRPAVGGPPTCALNSAGVRSPRLMWGRSSLSCRRQCSIQILASVRFRNHSSDRHSLKNAPPRPSMSTWPVNRNGWALTITDVSWRNGVVVPNPVVGGAVPLGSGWPVAGAKTSSTGGVCVTGS